MNIIMCGLPMCGKSTLGKSIADKLEWKFIDTDSVIESLYNTKTGHKHTCRQIYTDHGEDFFRSLELEVISSLKGVSECVISLGGGALCCQDNIAAVKSLGYLIYIQVPKDILWERIEAGGIPAYLDPMYPKDSFYSLADTRIPNYQSAADIIYNPTERGERILFEEILEIKMCSHGQ